MPSSGTPEQKARWAANKKKRIHERNVDALEHELNRMSIDEREITDIPLAIKLLKKLARLRKREAELKEQGILPQISDAEWDRFNHWLVMVQSMLVGYAVEPGGPKAPNDVADAVLELAAEYAIPFDFMEAHPVEARARVLELYAEACQGQALLDPIEPGAAPSSDEEAKEE